MTISFVWIDILEPTQFMHAQWYKISIIVQKFGSQKKSLLNSKSLKTLKNLNFRIFNLWTILTVLYHCGMCVLYEFGVKPTLLNIFLSGIFKFLKAKEAWKSLKWPQRFKEISKGLKSSKFLMTFLKLRILSHLRSFLSIWAFLVHF